MIPRAVFTVLMAAIALVAVPFASNRMWAWALLAIVVGALLIAMAVAVAINPGNLTVAWRHYRWPAIGYLAVLIWTLVQASTLTPAFLHHPLWSEASAILRHPVASAISLDVPATLSEATRFLAYGGIFWLAMQFAGRDNRARAMLWVIVLAVAANAAYGLAVYFTGSQSILWFHKWAYLDSVTGTFVNRNHFGTYLGLGLIIVMTFMIEELRRISAGISLRTVEGLVRVSETVGPRLYLLIGLVALFGVSILMTGSRGALVAVAAGLIVLLAGISLSSRVSADRVGRFALVLAAAGLLALAASGQLVLKRIEESGGAAERMALYGATVHEIGERPLLGTGPGTFADVFMAKRPQSIGVTRLRLLYDHAHDTYLEVALESGVPALIVLLLVAAYGIGVFVRGVRSRRHNDLLPAIGIGATGLVATHALVDFSLEIPAVAATFLAIAGIAYAQSFNHAHRLPPTGEEPAPDPV